MSWKGWQDPLPVPYPQPALEVLSAWLYHEEEKQRGSAWSLPALGGAAGASSAALLAPDGMGTRLGLNTSRSPPAAVGILDPFSVALTCVYWRYS